MPFVSVNGVSLHYQQYPAEQAVTPDCPPVLLLAGIASDGASWQPVIEPLRQQFGLLIPDNRCTGRTTPVNVESSRESMVTDILCLLDELDIERVSIVGHSMGGMLGWTLACTAPERVANLVSAAALPGILPARIELFRSLQDSRSQGNERDWLALFYQFLFRSEFFDNRQMLEAAVAASLNYPHKQQPEAFYRQVAALESFLPALPLERLNCPVTLLTGSHDVLTTPEMVEGFSKAYPQVRTRIVEDAAHALHWEQPDCFVQIVQEALTPVD